MALNTGTKLGPYEIVASIGAGGMGEVYRAKDTRLGRDVAIKVLPQHLSNNPDLKARFEREAKTISQLSHAHICALYDVGRQDGVDFIVLELLDGESLAERLKKGPLSLEQTLAYGMEIAEALETAHKSGVVHRDLKPGNIMLTKSGVKLLDFGLAKPLAATAAGASSSAFSAMTASHASPSQPLTAEGTIVGTFQYLSPEQLEGHEADARADIFALGCVLYEMATGKRAFHGKTQASIVAAIIASEPPPISAVQPLTPPAFERVVKICLAKDPEERWQTAHDVRLQLKWIAEAGSQAGAPAPVVARRRLTQRVAWMVSAVAIVIAIAFAAAYFVRARGSAQSLQASLLPPKDFSFAPTEIEISPDGSKLAFIAMGKDGKSSLWMRPVNSLASQQLAGTDGAHYPFWSPDSKAVGFFADVKMKKIDAAGGPVMTLADAPSGRGGTWNREGTIIFSPKSNGDGLYEVSSAGGAVTEVQHADKAKGEDEFRWPFFMPDGRHYVFYVESPQSLSGASAKDPVTGIYFAELGSKTKTRLLNVETGAKYANGYLFYVSQRNLMAQPFDPPAGKFTGAAFPVAQQVESSAFRYIGAFSVSNAGTLEYLAGENAPSQLVWSDREGKELSRVAVDGSPDDPSLSPDGTKVAADVQPAGGGNSDIWVYDLARAVGTRVTTDGAEHAGPTWSRNGQRVFYSKHDSAGRNVYSRAGSGLGPEEPVLLSDAIKYLNDTSPDGKTLVYMNFVGANGGGSRLWVHETESGKKDYPLLNTNFTEINAQFSPDGHWVAYESNESGKFEIYAIAYPSLATKVQISSGGGAQPRWRKDGKEIFYVATDRKMMGVPTAPKGTGLEVGTPRPLFDSKIFQILGTLDEYDVSADGQKFLISTRPEAAPEPATIYANWQEDFRKK